MVGGSGGGTALFSNGGSGRGASQTAKALCEFKAGKMTLSGNIVTADKRRGLVQIDQGEDQLMHFKWKDRGSGKVEDDLLIFPDDIEFKKVPQCTTGRVFLLKFKSSSRKMFFWMQEPKTDKDDEYCKKVNDLLNNPPAPGSSRSGGNSDLGSSGLAGLDLGNLRDTELQTLLGSMNQQQLMQFLGAGNSGLGNLASILGGAGGSPLLGSRQRSHGGSRSSSERSSRGPNVTTTTAATTPTTSAASSASASSTPTTTTTTTTSSSAGKSNQSSSTPPNPAGPIQLADLQSILSGIQVPGSYGADSAETGPSVDLSSGITAEAVQPLLTNPDFVKRMKELLPADHQNKDSVENEIKGTIQSPQFQQAMGLFSSAFQSARLAPLIREFNLGDQAVAAATAGDLEAFVKALQNDSKDKTEPEDMALD